MDENFHVDALVNGHPLLAAVIGARHGKVAKRQKQGELQ